MSVPPCLQKRIEIPLRGDVTTISPGRGRESGEQEVQRVLPARQDSQKRVLPSQRRGRRRVRRGLEARAIPLPVRRVRARGRLRASDHRGGGIRRYSRLPEDEALPAKFGEYWPQKQNRNCDATQREDR